MSFFDPPPPAEPEADPPQPLWAGPGDDELGEEVVVERTIGESTSALISLRSVTAYEHGLVLHVAGRKKQPIARPSFDPDAEEFFPNFDHLNADSEAFLRFGIQFADGGKATNLERRQFWFENPEPPAAPFLDAEIQNDDTTIEAWIWPLPPPDALLVVAEWVAERIPESRLSLPVAPLVEAARRARGIW